MKKSLPLLITTLVITIFSCKKDDALSKTPDNTNPVKDTPVLLTRLVVLDTTSASPNDTIAIYEVHYDASYRPLTLNFTSYEYTSVPSYFTTLNYEYQGADTMASKTTMLTTSIYNGATTYSHDTIYYTYDAGKLIADSLTGSDGTYYQKHHYSYFPNRIEASYSYLPANPNGARDGHDVYLESFTNGNLTHEVDTVMYNYISSGSPAEQWLTYDYTLTYTNNPDPFYKVISPIKRIYYSSDDWIWENTPLFVSPNLPSSSYRLDGQWNTGGTGSSANSTSTGEYAYTFRADGYPLIMRQVDHEYGPWDRYFKLLYTYNK